MGPNLRGKAPDYSDPSAEYSDFYQAACDVAKQFTPSAVSYLTGDSRAGLIAQAAIAAHGGRTSKASKTSSGARKSTVVVVEPDKSSRPDYLRKTHLGTAVPLASKSMRDSLGRSRPAIGEELITSLENQEEPGVILNRQRVLGKYDPIGMFLSNLMQNGQTVSQWSGIIRAANSLLKDESSGARTNICQNFRHRFSQNDPIVFGNPTANNNIYPYGFGTVLYPNSNASYAWPPGSQTSFEAGIYIHKPNENCWAPLNRPDLEDMCWNLNKLKLAPLDSANLTPNPVLESQYENPVPVFDKEAHRRQSQIEYNNLYDSNINNADPDDIRIIPPRYRYEAVLKGGHVKYKFVNKESTGARVEVIVYRMKKNARSNNSFNAYAPVDPTIIEPGMTGANANPLSNICHPIMNGFKDKTLGKLGTDNLQFTPGSTTFANEFDPAWIYNNPEYPLLPEMKATRQTNLSYKEISRTAVCLPAGGAREITVKFDGVKYDPADIYKFLNRDSASGSTPYQLPGILDDYSYSVVISVCGVKMTRLVNDTDPDGNELSAPLFDVHSNAEVMYTAEYVENLGAACYKHPGRVNLFNNALQTPTKILPNPTPGASTSVTPVTTIPVEKALRLTNTSTPGDSAYVKNTTT